MPNSNVYQYEPTCDGVKDNKTEADELRSALARLIEAVEKCHSEADPIYQWGMRDVTAAAANAREVLNRKGGE